MENAVTIGDPVEANMSELNMMNNTIKTPSYVEPFTSELFSDVS